MYTNSVANAYFRPLRGVDEAGDGGRSCPSRSICVLTFSRAPLGLPALDPGGADMSANKSTGD